MLDLIIFSTLFSLIYLGLNLTGKTGSGVVGI